MPISWRGTIAQYVGRLHRLHEHKQDVRVHDYADLDVPMLAHMFDKRCRGYEAVGYSISLPASAAPGWNHQHGDVARIAISNIERFEYDPRLFALE